MKDHTVLIIAPNDGLLFVPAGIIDIFTQANRYAGEGLRRYRTTVATTARSRVIHGRSGLNLLADECLDDLDPDRSWDTVVVTNRADDPAESEIIAGRVSRLSARCGRMVSMCGGALIFAKAGLLEGRRATTHWRNLDELAALSPTTEIDRDSIYVRDGGVWTSAGASSGFDLTLALVAEDMGAAVAREVARDLVLFLRRPGGQAQFSRFLASQADPDTPVGRVQVWALEHLDADLSVGRLADEAAMSPRNFCRVFARETGTTPARFIEDLRLESARGRLEQGHESLDEVASACGLGSALNLRRLFERNLGVNPSDYRIRFGMN